jgi:hypothetical protein
VTQVPSTPAAPLPALSEESGSLIGHAEAVRLLQEALLRGTPVVLVLGPVGCGKTAFLKDMAARGLGAYAASVDDAFSLGAASRLLVDGLKAGDEPKLSELLANTAGRQVVLAAQGTLGRAELTLSQGTLTWPLRTSQALVDATDGRLPMSVAEQVQAAIELNPLSEAQLLELAERFGSRRADGLELAPAALRSIVKLAIASGRGARELESLMRRVPAGSWDAKATAKKKRKKK